MGTFDFNTENILGLKNKIVYIEGDLIIDTDKLPLIGFQSAAFVGEECKEYATRVVQGDLIINDSNVDEYSSFTDFLAKGDIIQYKGGDDNLPYQLGMNDVYWKRRNEFYEILETVDENTPQLLLQLLYVSIFSRYEYSIINNLLYFSLHDMENIVKFFKSQKVSALNKLIKGDLPDRIKEMEYMSFIRKCISLGDSCFVKNLIFYLLVVDVNIPSSFGKGYKIRNAIVHRAGCELNGCIISIDKKDLVSMSKEIDEFSDYISKLFHDNEMSRINSLRADMGLPPLQMNTNS